MTHVVRLSHRARGRPLALGIVCGVTVLAACGSGRASDAGSVSARPSAAADSVRAATLNRRIEAASARESLDREARRLGVPRQSVIKMWLAERLERKAS